MIWSIVYIVGVVISNVFFLKLESERRDIVVLDLVMIFLFSLCSWLMILALIFIDLDRKRFWKKVVIHKRK